eukprot:222669-Prymnesium_polylepis.2
MSRRSGDRCNVGAHDCESLAARHYDEEQRGAKNRAEAKKAVALEAHVRARGRAAPLVRAIAAIAHAVVDPTAKDFAVERAGEEVA